MSGFDDHVGFTGDWTPLSPSPRALFSSLMGDDPASRLVAEPINENKSDIHSSGVEQPTASVNSDQNDGAKIGVVANETSKHSLLTQQNPGSRGGLLERLAARAGFNAPRLNTESIRPPNLTLDQAVGSPRMSIPPGVSPTALLDSPVFLSNSLVQPSPTTGTFPFAASGNGRNQTLSMYVPDKNKDNPSESIKALSFSFKPVKESIPSLFMGATSRSTQNGDVHVHSENSHLPRSVEPSEPPPQHGMIIHQHVELPRSSTEMGGGGSIIASEPRGFHSMEQSPPDEQQDEDADQRGSPDVTVVDAPAEDGYNWRKYGQKQVKGSEYPRGYYKCTHPNCPVKKKVERSHEGHITEIIYKGVHNHSKPPNRRSILGLSQPGSGEQAETDWWNENFEATPSAQLGSEFDSSGPSSAHNGTQFESGDAVDGSSTFSTDEGEDDNGTVSMSLGYDCEGDESESKKRKLETYATEGMASRSIREPRVVVQTTSEVDILDDGYRWRKYGQKVVKGNPNPRSYYKCTSTGCNVRKHVERASHDLKSVITTYEGKHNHDIPAARNSSHVNTGASNTSTQSTSVQSRVHRPEPAHLQNRIGQPGRLQFGATHGFGYAMNQQGIPNFSVVNPCFAPPRSGNDTSLMLSKGEPDMGQAYNESCLNIFSGGSAYHQIMNRFPLGPEM